MHRVVLRAVCLAGFLAVLPCASYGQIFWDPSDPQTFTSSTAVCIAPNSHQITTSAGSDCAAFVGAGPGTNQIVLGSSNTITLQGAPGGGDIIVGNGIHVTTLDGATGNINLGGSLAVNSVTGSVDMGGVVVKNVGTPVAGTDAANKAYVDSVANGGSKSFSNLTVTGTSTFGSGGNTSIDAGGNLSVKNSFGDIASVTTDVGNLFGGFKATSGSDPRIATLSAPGLTLSNGTANTVTLDTQTGNASFAGTMTVGGLATFNAGTQTNGNAVVTGNQTVGGTLGVTGLATFNGGTQTNGNAVVTGNQTVGGKLGVTGLASLNGGVNVTGGSNFNGVATFTNTAVAGQGSTSVNGGLVTLTNGSNPAQTITLNANADPVFTVSGGTPATTTTVDNGNVTAGGNVKVGGTATVTGQSFLNGGATVSNNLTVTPGTAVDFGGNRLQNVAAPVAPADAVNKAYVDNGFGQLRQEDRRLQSGVAMAAAIPHTVVLPGERFAFGVDWANYNGTNGVGFDGAIKLGQLNFAGGPVSVQGNAGFAASSDSTGRFVSKAGVRFGF
jgi:hypothetical protein